MPEQDTMQEMMERSKPGKEHQILARHAGEWNVTMKTMMAPDGQPGEGKGTVTIKSLLGGRVTTEEMRANFGEMPFEGFGTMGFNNFTGKYWQTWTDWSTGLFHSEGTASPDGKTITFTGKMDMPEQDRKGVDTKTVYRFLSDDHYIFEMWTKSPDGREFKGLEADYRRK